MSEQAKGKVLQSFLVEAAVCAAAYLCSFAASRAGWHVLACLLLAGLALGIYVCRFRRSKNLVDMKGLFALAWIGGQGLACLQLSNLQKDWSPVTWIAFFAAYLGFSAGFLRRRETGERRELARDAVAAGRLLWCACGLAALSWICFLIEYLAVGFIPLFSDKPHAYSYFHVSGVHYFTISCILAPAITVLWWKVKETWRVRDLILLAAANVTAVAVPVLCVSRFQLLFAVGFAVVVYLLVCRELNWKILLLLLAVLIPAYVGLTVARNHDVAYLNGIFDMKNKGTPIFITQPYIYVANNFENFNCLVEQIAGHTYGIRMLFPVFALTGLKFLFPQLISSPIYITKPELTTLTLFYDAYYDFGLAGVILLALALGFAARKLARWVQRGGNPVSCLYYGQVAIYLGLSFFTTWFSNPTTWFWLALTTGMYLFVGYRKKERRDPHGGEN